MEDKKQFQSEILYDLPLHQEFTKLTTQTLGITVFFRFMTIVCMLSFLPMLRYSYSRWLFLVLCGVIAIPRLLQLRNQKKGDLTWEQTLHRNEGKPPRQQVTLDETGIRSRSLTKDHEISDSFDQVRLLMESENLLLVMTKIRMIHIIDKRTLTGGTREELVTYLRRNCPNLKNKIKTTKLHRIAERLLWAAMILSLLVCLANALHLPDKFRGRLTNDVSVLKMAEELTALDINISNQAMDTILLWESNDTKLFPTYPGVSKIQDLLIIEGMGQYDEETGVWTPSTSGLYWFSLAFEDTDSCYTDFLTGVDAMDEGLTFSGISEDNAPAMPDGERTVTLAFDYQGQSHSITAEDNGEYFDGFVLFELGKILNQDDDPSNLWYTVDNQGVLMYYGTAEEAAELERKTGLIFLNPAENRLYS